MDELVSSSCVIEKEEMLPAVAQGAIGIQCRSSDTDIIEMLRGLNDPDTEDCVKCERAFLAELDGNCRTPIAGQATVSRSGILRFQGMIAKADGSDVLFASGMGDRKGCVDIGTAVARDIKQKLGPEKFKEFQETYDN
jgi:hydroxymethylbilane synthase